MPGWTLVLLRRGLAGFEVAVSGTAGCDFGGVATSDSTGVLVSLDKGVGSDDRGTGVGSASLGKS